MQKSKLTEAWKSCRVEVLLFILLAANYAYFFPRWADPNQNSRLDMVIAAVEDGTFQIDPYVWNTVDYARVGDHYYSDKAPGTALLGIPLYAGLNLALNLPVVDPVMEKLANSSAFQATLREEGSGIQEQKVRFAIAQVVLAFFLAAIPTALLGVLLYRVLSKLTGSHFISLLVVLIYGLLTPAYPYAGALYGHQLGALLIFFPFYLVQSRKEMTVPLSFLAGLMLGYSVLTEYPLIVLAGIVYLYVFYRVYHTRQMGQIVWLTLGGALAAAGLLAYNTAVFGGPFQLGYAYSELWTDQHSTGFMSLSMPSIEAAWGITFGKFRGLFFLSPVLLPGLIGFFLWRRKAKLIPEWWVSIASVVAMFLFNASSVMWWGGYAVGPRYLLPMLPFWTLALGVATASWWNSRIFRLIFGFLALWSFVAVWGLSLAEQAFPPDTILNPLVEYAWPNWQAGNIARNVGTILGLTGLLSLLPILIMNLLVAGGLFFPYFRNHPVWLPFSELKRNIEVDSSR